MINKLKFFTLTVLIAIATSNFYLANAQADDKMDASTQANNDFEDQLKGTELLSALRKGGYIIYFRHATTEEEYIDPAKEDVDNCATQLVLSEEGWQEAQTIGDGFEENFIPVGEVITSEYCRAWKTADLAFGDYEKNSVLNPLTEIKEITKSEAVELEDEVMKILTDQPEEQTNTVIVGHSDVFEAVTGINPDPPGMAYILKPGDDNSFDLVANVLPEEWAKLNDN